MENNNVSFALSLFAQLTQSEIDDFKRFLRYTLYCKSTDNLELLTEYLSDKKDKAFNLDHLAVSVLKRKRYKDADIYKLFKSYSEALERFLAFQEFKHDTAQQQYYLSRRFANADDDLPFQQAVQTWNEALQKLPEGRHKLLHTFWSKELQWNHPGTDRHKKSPALAQEAHEAYEAYHQSNHYLYQSAAILRASIIADTNPPAATQITPEMFPTLCRSLFELCKDEALTPDQVTDFLDTYRPFFSKIDPSDKTAARKLLVNCCTIHLQRGQQAFAALLPEIFTSIPPEMTNSDSEFVNQSIALGIAGHLEAMRTFIEHPPKVAQPKLAAATVRAYYHFFNQAYPEALTVIETIKNTRLLRYKIRYHSLHLRLCYLLDNEVDLALDSFNKYFQRNQLMPQDVIKSYLQLSDYVRKMWGLRKAMHPSRLPAKEKGVFVQKYVVPTVSKWLEALEQERYTFYPWLKNQLKTFLPNEDSAEKTALGTEAPDRGKLLPVNDDLGNNEQPEHSKKN